MRRSEAGRVAYAVRALREANAEQRAPLVKALEATACTAPDVCELRRSCAEAYRVEAGAHDALRAVRAATASEAAPPAGAAELLGRAEAELGKARELAKLCADLEGEARRSYSL